ncbi:ACP S-malonyltransferase [Actinoplanes sp. NPDC051859]|uniref:ACP S-malonyltransferase n=1 Tax=Actinoplanes sp. NPDC051859 TaxID=3363909 RepID=UPI0037A56387
MLAHRVAAVFPGQGSQIGAMAAALTQDSVHAHYLHTADEILDMPLSRLCLDGTPSELRDTAIAQPAILLTSLIALAQLRERGLEPAIVAGHSLGEYTALVAAGVLEWTAALRLVRRRGQLMARVGDTVAGGMAAILGIDGARVQELCINSASTTGHTIEIANYNSEQQTVVSGTEAGLAAATAAARELGADVVPLKVSAPFHCSLMRDIEQEFAAVLDDVVFGTPKVPVLSSVTARPLLDAEAAARALRGQLCSPVRWLETIHELMLQEVSAFVEVGPGRVLTNLGRTIAPDIPSMAAPTAGQLHDAVARLTAQSPR